MGLIDLDNLKLGQGEDFPPSDEFKKLRTQQGQINWAVQALDELNEAAGKITPGEKYTLPAATADALGGVKVGDNLTITEDGTLSAAGSEKYTLPAATADALGGVKVGDNLTITEDGTLSAAGGEKYTAGAGIEINSKNVVSAKLLSSLQGGALVAGNNGLYVRSAYARLAAAQTGVVSSHPTTGVSIDNDGIITIPENAGWGHVHGDNGTYRTYMGLKIYKTTAALSSLAWESVALDGRTVYTAQITMTHGDNISASSANPSQPIPVMVDFTDGSASENLALNLNVTIAGGVSVSSKTASARLVSPIDPTAVSTAANIVVYWICGNVEPL